MVRPEDPGPRVKLKRILPQEAVFVVKANRQGAIAVACLEGGDGLPEAWLVFRKNEVNLETVQTKRMSEPDTRGE
jgi:hypothetical protein